MTEPLTFDDMVAQVRRLPGWTLYPPYVDAIGDRVEVSKRIAEASGTKLEWSEGGSPRFMPTDKAEADKIRLIWLGAGIDCSDHGAPWGEK